MKSIRTKFLNTIRALFKNKFFEQIIRLLINSRLSVIRKLGIKLAPNNYQYQKNTIRTFTKNSIHLKVDISDYIGHYLYFGFPDAGYNKLFELASNKKMIFDVGANIGFTALTMSKLVASGGKVIAFEPDQNNFKKLLENKKLNNELPIQLEPIGLGNKKEQVKLEIVTQSNLGGNRISNNPEKEYSIVDITTLNQYCVEHSISEIDLIKIDVEGFEYEVLKGAESEITKYLPDLFIEVDDTNLKFQHSSAKELIAFLESLYKHLYNAQTGERVSSTNDFTNCHFDLIANK